MARGWESKSIEIQIEESDNDASFGLQADLSAPEIEKRRKLEDLQLQRSRILQEMASGRNPRYRAMLEDKLAHLDHKICQFR